MTYSEIVSQIKSEIRFEQDQNADTLIEQSVNRTYRSLAQRFVWRELTVYGEQFTTESGVATYAAPYPLQNLLPDSVFYDYDSTATYTGSPLHVIADPKTAARIAWMGQQNDPIGILVSGMVGSNLYSTGTVAVANEGLTVTGAATVWDNSTMDAQWIRFGHQTSSDLSGGNYGYKIASVNSTTSITLEEAYRGATLATAKYAIRPSTTPLLRLVPAFSASGDVVRYSYLRAPRRLYNGDDTPEVEILSDVLVSETCALLAQYSEDQGRYGIYKQRAGEQLRAVIGQFGY